jgi:YD repeat-containing protein
MNLISFYPHMFKIIVFLLLLPLATLAQTTIPDYTKTIDILPPSPNSASLGKYGDMNVGLVSGTANINIPLQGFSSNNIKLPISLSYSSNGLKVDELASRVGLSWTLNAGGAITRTVMGNIDENTTRLSPPADVPNQTQNLLNFAQTLLSDSFDAQPDIFSFNFDGYTGRFLLDSNRNPVILTYSALKIEQNFTGTAWNFKVTAPDGVQYYFGGTAATETTNKSQTGCGRILPHPAPTAWYLNEIVHPNRDTVYFGYSMMSYQYETGVNQTMYSRLITSVVASSGTNSPPNPPNTTCISALQTTTPILNQISSTSGGKILFSYISRSDNIDRLLSRIEYYQPGQTTLYKSYNLTYQNVHTTLFNSFVLPSDTALCNRPFLMRLDEGTSANSQLKTHLFSYNSLNQLPERLSFAQDSYGYFNGAHNTTLIPPPDYATEQSFFTGATANRNPNPAYSVCGTLSKIQYPTGGTDSLIYEGNTYPGTVSSPPGTASQSVSGTGIGRLTPNSIKSPNFTIAGGASVTISASCSYNASSGYQLDAIHNIAHIAIRDSTTNTTVYSNSVPNGNTITSSTVLNGTDLYYLQLTPYGAAAQAVFSVSYPVSSPPTNQTVNTIAPGLRINAIITKSNAGDNNPQIKSYYYYNSSSPAISSGNFVYNQQFFKYQPIYSTQGLTVGYYIVPSEYDYYTMYSYSLTNLYVYPAAVYYSSVIESSGYNFANGGVEHHFQLRPDLPGLSVLGDPIPGISLSSHSWENALELYSCTFKMVNNAMTPVKKVFTHYNVDSRVNNQFDSYVVNTRYAITYSYTPPIASEFSAYDLAGYSNFQKWVYVDSVRTWNYDQTGQNYLEELSTYSYGNPSHALLTKSTATTSDGRIMTNRVIYPADTTLAGDEETARQALIANYMIGTKLISQQYLNSSVLNTTKTSYSVYPNGLVLPHFYNVQIGNDTTEKRVVFYNYNNNGGLLYQSLINGPLTSYQWGYNNMYPVASVKNAKNTDIFYDSFEEGDGTSSICKTGHYGFNGAYVKTLNNLDAGNYILSYWLLLTNGTWSLVISPVTVTGTSYPITISGQIDDVRFYPAAALMTTYTYDPLIGMTSSADAKGEITYYEYDGFQRLMNVRDKDGNIIKHTDYHYQGQ